MPKHGIDAGQDQLEPAARNLGPPHTYACVPCEIRQRCRNSKRSSFYGDAVDFEVAATQKRAGPNKTARRIVLRSDRYAETARFRKTHCCV